MTAGDIVHDFIMSAIFASNKIVAENPDAGHEYVVVREELGQSLI